MKTMFEKFGSLLVGSYFLMTETVNGLAGSNYINICSLSLHPGGLENQTVNLAWDLINAADCIASPGHIQAAASCNASFFGTPNNTDFSIWHDDRTVFRLCRTPNERGMLSQFLFIEEITIALKTQLETLGACLLKQPYTAEFCEKQASEGSAAFNAAAPAVLGALGGLIVLSLAVLIIIKCNGWKRDREYAQVYSNNSLATSNNSNASSTTTQGEDLPLLGDGTEQARRSGII